MPRQPRRPFVRAPEVVLVEVGEPLDARALIRELAKRVLDHGDERLRVERLRDRVERAGLFDEVIANPVTLRAHQHDRRLRERRVRAEHLAELVAVHAWHDEVEQDEVGGHLAACERFVGVLAVGGDLGLVAISLEQSRDDVSNRGAVVDDEDARSHAATGARRREKHEEVVHPGFVSSARAGVFAHSRWNARPMRRSRNGRSRRFAGRERPHHGARQAWRGRARQAGEARARPCDRCGAAAPSSPASCRRMCIFARCFSAEWPTIYRSSSGSRSGSGRSRPRTTRRRSPRAPSSASSRCSSPGRRRSSIWERSITTTPCSMRAIAPGSASLAAKR